METRFSVLRADHLLPPPKGRFLVVISVRDSVDLRAIVQLEGLSQLLSILLSSKLISELLVVVLRTRFFTKDYGCI
jgi:hypothetical protein